MADLEVEILPPGTAEGLFRSESLPVCLPEGTIDPHNSTSGPTHAASAAGSSHAGTGTSNAQAPAAAAVSQFQSRIIERTPMHQPKSKNPSHKASSSQQQLEFNLDVLMHTGGLIWALDFCPQAPSALPNSTAEQCELLAAAVHPAGVTRNKAGQLLQGRGAVQIWAVPNSQQAQCCPDGAPKLLMCIVHEGCVTWDVKWCPDPSRVLTKPMSQQQQQPQAELPPQTGPKKRARNEPEPRTSQQTESLKPLPTVGILAFVAGDGAVHITSVPDASDLVDPIQDPAAAGTDAEAKEPPSIPALRLPDQYAITSDMLGGSVPCSLEWQRPVRSAATATTGSSSATARQGQEGLKLLVGCCDGMVAGWKLPCAPLQQLQCMFQIKADTLPVWCMNWCPASAVFGSRDQLQDHTFMTLSHGGMLKIWDDRDLCLPLQKHLMSRISARGAAWVVNPLSVFTAHEDGTMRQFFLDPIFHNSAKDVQLTSLYTGQDQGCLWSVAYSMPLSCLVYCGDDGVAVVVLVEMTTESRKRLPHAPIGGIVRHKGTLRVLRADEVAGAPTLYTGGVYFSDGTKKKQIAGRGKLAGTPNTLKDEMQALYTCAISPNADNGKAWVAYGGMAGLLRCQRISVESCEGK